MATVGEIHILVENDAIHYESALTIPEIVLFLDMTKQMVLNDIIFNAKDKDGTPTS